MRRPKRVLRWRRRQQLIEAAWAMVRAQGRMLDGWAEGDDAVKRSLWQGLHKAGDALRLELEGADRG